MHWFNDIIGYVVGVVNPLRVLHTTLRKHMKYTSNFQIKNQVVSEVSPHTVFIFYVRIKVHTLEWGLEEWLKLHVALMSSEFANKLNFHLNLPIFYFWSHLKVDFWEPKSDNFEFISSMVWASDISIVRVISKFSF